MKRDIKSVIITVIDLFSTFTLKAAAEIQQSRCAMVLFFLSFFAPVLFVVAVFIVVPSFSHQPSRSAPESFPVASEPVESDRKQENQALREQIDSLQSEKSFQKVLLESSSADTFGLALNLRDSLFSLYIKGIPVRHCKLVGFHYSAAFHTLLRQGDFSTYNAAPFVLERDFATIKKIPIKVIKAPKDTTEALAQMDKALQVERPDVYCRLFFDRDFVLDVSQSNPASFVGMVRQVIYTVRWTSFVVFKDLNTLRHFKMPAHRMWVKIRLVDNDAKAMYRALDKGVPLVLLM